MAVGAKGGKLLGAGGGGSSCSTWPEQQAAVRKSLEKLIEVNIDIDHAGSKIVVYEPDGLHLR